MQPDNNFGNLDAAATTSNASSATGGETTTLRPTIEINSAATARSAEPSDAAVQLAEDLRKFQAVANQIKANLTPESDFEQRCNQSFSLANDLFGHAPTWICFFREVLAVDGLTHRLFPTPEEYAQFMTTTHFDQLQQMLTALRSRDLPENDPNDPQRMITVRLPKSLHEALCVEAGRLNISVNKLCISRLLQVLDQKMIPETVSKPRGRKPRARNPVELESSAAPVGQ